MSAPYDPYARDPREQPRNPQQPPGRGHYQRPIYPPQAEHGPWPGQPAQTPEPLSSFGPPGTPQQAWAPDDYQPPRQRRDDHQAPPRRSREPRSFPYVVTGLSVLVVIAGIGGFIAGRNTAPRASTPTSAATSAAPAASSPAAAPAAAPVTATAAKSAAKAFFSLYAAGQYAATYPLLDPQARRRIPEATWVTVHDRCKGTAAGLSYKMGTPTLAGRSAVMSVSLAGAASSLGSEEVTFVYRGGRWLYAPSDLASYSGSPVRIVARLKAAGNCG